MTDHRAEQETIIRYDATRDVVAIFTGWPVVARKLAKRGLIPYKTTVYKGKPNGWFYRTPYSTLTWTIRVRNLRQSRRGLGTTTRFQKKPTGSGEDTPTPTR